MPHKRKFIQCRLVLVAVVTGLQLIAGCFKDVEENKLYILSPSSKEFFVFNSKDLSPILIQPLSFAEFGKPKRFNVSHVQHQIHFILENSNQLIRIGTEPPFSYSPLAFTQYGSSPLVQTVANPAKKNVLVLSETHLYLVDDFGNVLTSQTPTPTPSITPTPSVTPSPTPSASPTASPTATPTATPFFSPSPTVTPTPVGSTSGSSSIALPANCKASSVSLNLGVQKVSKGSSTQSSSSGSASPTGSPSATASPQNSTASTTESSDAGDFFGSGERYNYSGGDVALVTCLESNQVILFDTQSFGTFATIGLAADARPSQSAFIRTPNETGDSVTGKFVVWNTNNTFEMIDAASKTLVSGSPFRFAPASAQLAARSVDLGKGLVMTSFAVQERVGFLDVRDIDGKALTGSPFKLITDCGVSGAGGIFSETVTVELTQEQKDAGMSTEDSWIYYTCPDSGVVSVLSTNTGLSFLIRIIGDKTKPTDLVFNPKQGGVLYVTLKGGQAPAPGVMALKKGTLADAFFPSAVTFTQAVPEGIHVIP